jgi:DNA-binding NtrC family response regulator
MSDRAAPFRILLAEDEQTFREDTEAALRKQGCDVIAVSSGREALARLESEEFHLLISDVRMPPPDGLELLRWVKRERPQVEVLILTGQRELLENPRSARDAIRDGAFDYLSKPVSSFDLAIKVERVRERWDLLAERERLRRWASRLAGEDLEEGRFEHLVGRSRPVLELFALARKVAVSDAVVLIRGESGTGKTMLAAAIHNHSRRSGAPFVKINSGAIPENLLESEIFGHELGAFTGAVRRKEGLFEVAEGGTVFLDEIGDLPVGMQVKLLAAIEEKRFMRVGERRRSIATGIIAATHRNLEDGCGRGIPRGSLLSGQRIPAHHAAASGAAGGYPSIGGTLLDKERIGSGPDEAGGRSYPLRPPVSREYPGAGKPDRARGDPRRGRSPWTGALPLTQEGGAGGTG